MSGKLTDEADVERCKAAMSKPGPMNALALIASGRVEVELYGPDRDVHIVTLDGKRVRDPEFPNDASRKMGLAGGWPLYRAGMIDQFGVVTPAGRAALLEP